MYKGNLRALFYLQVAGEKSPRQLALVRYYTPDEESNRSILKEHGYEPLIWNNGDSTATADIKSSYEVVDVSTIHREIYVSPNFNADPARLAFSFYYDPNYWFGYTTGN